MEPPLTDEKKKQLNQLGGRILREAGINFAKENDYNWLRKSKFAGYANILVQNCWNDSIMMNEADCSVYRELIDIDLMLGTNASEQLFWCLYWTTRLDLIKECF